MRLGIKTKIFLTMLAGALLLVIGMSLFVRWSFDRGFLRFVNRVEQNQLSTLAQEAEDLFLSLGSWEALRANPHLWRSLLRQSHPAPFRGPGMMRGRGPGYHGMGPPGRGGFVGRLQLLDSEKRLIFGRTGLTNLRVEPITVDGQTVGYLALAPQRLLADRHQLDFATEQRRTFGWIAVMMILFAALLSLPLSRRMVKRVKILADGTHALTAGQYQVRIPAAGNDELAQLSQDFNALAKVLEQNEKARRAWVADISHELRTPLSVLRGEIEAIQDGIRQATPKTVNTLHDEVMRLTRLVEDLYQLSLSDMGALSYTKTDVELADLVETTLELYRDRMVQKKIVLNFQAERSNPTVVFADPERLQQLLQNLLENSLRYTDPDGQIRVRLTTDTNRAIIDLCDSSPGVAATELPRLFERLFRVEASRNRASGGGGLGLSICRTIVEAHGGHIRATASDLGGLCIQIELPMKETGHLA